MHRLTAQRKDFEKRPLIFKRIFMACSSSRTVLVPSWNYKVRQDIKRCNITRWLCAFITTVVSVYLCLWMLVLITAQNLRPLRGESNLLFFLCKILSFSWDVFVFSGKEIIDKSISIPLCSWINSDVKLLLNNYFSTVVCLIQGNHAVKVIWIKWQSFVISATWIQFPLVFVVWVSYVL